MSELRVHGVTGAPPDEILDRPLYYRVAGDDNAGFYRPRGPGAVPPDPADPVTEGPAGLRLEAYRWGNMTAGAASRALWLLLLPFMLGNVALWLRPAGERGRRLIGALTRLAALSLTSSLVLAVSGVALDLAAWQCAGDRACARSKSYLGFMATGFWSATGRRLAVAALVPAAVVALLWYLGRRTWQAYEKYPPGKEQPDADDLTAPGFWNGTAQVGRLRAVHVAAALGTLDVSLVVAYVVHTVDGWTVVLAVLTGLLLAACAAVVCVREMVSRDRPAPWAEPVACRLRDVAVALTIVTVGYGMLPHGDWPSPGALPGYARSVTWLFAAQVAVLLVLTVVGYLRRQRGVAFAGLGTPILSSLGVGLAAAFSAGLTFRAAGVLGSGARRPLVVPPSYRWAAAGFLVVALFVLVAGAVAYLRLSRLRAAARAAVDKEVPDCSRLGQIVEAVAAARLTDDAPTLFLVGYLPSAVGAVVLTVLALVGVRPPQAIAWAVNAGTWLVGLAVVGLATLGVRAYRSERLRRTVGILWDLGTFWPRSAHPLAPPCYAERAVPELVRRGTALAADGRVVLSGHSQGTVLAAAAILQLAPSERPGFALLTYGSPLTRLYARFFPRYFTPEILARIGRDVPWRNLWRPTDPIGGPIGAADVVDTRLRDPASCGPLPGDTVPPPIEGHFAYLTDPAFAEALAALRGPTGPCRPTP